MRWLKLYYTSTRVTTPFVNKGINECTVIPILHYGMTQKNPVPECSQKSSTSDRYGKRQLTIELHTTFTQHQWKGVSKAMLKYSSTSQYSVRNPFDPTWTWVSCWNHEPVEADYITRSYEWTKYMWWIRKWVVKASYVKHDRLLLR